MSRRKHPTEASEDTLRLFESVVPLAKRGGGQAVFVLPSGASVRVKRAKKMANQVHALWAEVLVVHVPNDSGSDRWYVVPPKWQLQHALSGRAKPHHALHPVECMWLRLDELEPTHEVKDPQNDLLAAAEDAAAEAAADEELADALEAAQYAQDEYESAVEDAAQRLEESLATAREKLKG